jgi:hypothetical protein
VQVFAGDQPMLLQERLELPFVVDFFVHIMPATDGEDHVGSARERLACGCFFRSLAQVIGHIGKGRAVATRHRHDIFKNVLMAQADVHRRVGVEAHAQKCAPLGFFHRAKLPVDGCGQVVADIVCVGAMLRHAIRLAEMGMAEGLVVAVFSARCRGNPHDNRFFVQTGSHVVNLQTTHHRVHFEGVLAILHVNHGIVFLRIRMIARRQMHDDVATTTESLRLGRARDMHGLPTRGVILMRIRQGSVRADEHTRCNAKNRPPKHPNSPNLLSTVCVPTSKPHRPFSNFSAGK